MDILVACCASAACIASVLRDTVVRTRVVHVIRNVMRLVSYQDRKKITKGYLAVTS